MPSLLSIFSASKPGVSVGTRKAVIPRWPAPGSVFAITMATSATVPLVIHVLVPSITHSPSSRSALVSMPATFEPWAGSEMALAEAASPAAMGGSNSSYIQSSPYSIISYGP
jgi:hypothetical protein